MRVSPMRLRGSEFRARSDCGQLAATAAGGSFRARGGGVKKRAAGCRVSNKPGCKRYVESDQANAKSKLPFHGRDSRPTVSRSPASRARTASCRSAHHFSPCTASSIRRGLFSNQFEQGFRKKAAVRNSALERNVVVEIVKLCLFWCTCAGRPGTHRLNR